MSYIREPKNPGDRRTIVLNEKETKKFLEIINSDASPAPKLVEAVKKYKDAIENGKLIVVDRKLP